MASARRAKFLQRELISGRLSIFRCGVILSLTFVTSKSHDFSHTRSLLAYY
jgi:hypothetical protein